MSVRNFMKPFRKKNKNRSNRMKKHMCKKYGWFCEANNTYEEGK